MNRSGARKSGIVLTMAAGLFAAGSLLFAGPASAQAVDCPAGGRGGSGGDAGRSTGGSGGLAFTVGGFATSGNADASGGEGGSARGGSGGRGGSGTLPICNQNTNGVTQAAPVRAAAPAARAAAPAAAPTYAAPAAAPRATVGTGGGTRPVYGTGGGRTYGTGGGLARTGARTSTELGLAGLAFIVGGGLLFFGQPLRRIANRA